VTAAASRTTVGSVYSYLQKTEEEAIQEEVGVRVTRATWDVPLALRHRRLFVGFDYYR
jgi:hypothetical protein